MEYTKLSNGVEMPMLGFGVYQIDNKATAKCVSEAIDVGYRLIDTAQMYGNEEGVGDAVRNSGLSREDFFITSKIWYTDADEERATAAIDRSLKRLGTDYLDLMLIHQPLGDYYGAYRALEQAYKDKKLRAIGVSNFYPDRLVDICNFAEIPPMVDQIETHVLMQRELDHKTMEKYHVVHESWGPLARGNKELFENPEMCEIAHKYGKSVGQVALRYLIQRNIVVIPKSEHLGRIKENFDVFDFSLSKEDMESIKALNKEETVSFSHYDPEAIQSLIDRFK